MKIGPKLVFVLANNQRERAGRPKLPLSWPGRLLWAAVRCNYVVQLISTQREAVAQQGKARQRKGMGKGQGTEGASSEAYAYAETIYAIYCLRWHSMSPSQASPGRLGPPVVHLPFGHLGIAGNLCKKMFDRFAIRRKNAKQTSGSGGQAMHQSSCQYANIYTHTYIHTHRSSASMQIQMYLHICPLQGVCIIAVPKLEIYYNFHTSVTRCRPVVHIPIKHICIYIPLYVTIIFRVSQCHYFDRRRLRWGSCSPRNVTSRRRAVAEAEAEERDLKLH